MSDSTNSLDLGKSLLHIVENDSHQCRNLPIQRDLLSFLSKRGHAHRTEPQTRGFEPGMLFEFESEVFVYKWPTDAFLDGLQVVCLDTYVRECSNEDCVDTKKKAKGAPACSWENFREWALTVIACQVTACKTSRSTYTSTALSMTLKFASYALESRGEPLAELESEVYELLSWLAQVSQIHDFDIRRNVSDDMVFEATESARSLGICGNRLWSLAVATGHDKDIPILLRGAVTETSNDSPDRTFRHLHHDSCPAEFCFFSDQDSTSVEQLHKCSSKRCGMLQFPFDSVERNGYTRTWWLHDHGTKPHTRAAAVPYVAISHVWSDGTGAGVQKEGFVNRCLFNYFKGAVKELGYEAIWWDTISIPREPEARRKAIRRINHDFRSAKCTLVHDQYLADFPWAEDGTPCLALVLSPWFTRAWTALELALSHDVWVIFRDPVNKNKRSIKNLRTEILAKNRISCSRAHLIASDIVSNVWKRKFNSISSILSVLKTRSTSKSRDMFIIAALLAGVLSTPQAGANTAHTPSELTKEVLRGLGTIESRFLFHTHTTMTQKGGFSWCPFDLLHGADVFSYKDRYTYNQIDAFVDKNGSVTGMFRYRVLQEADVKQIVPLGSHKMVEYKISAAMRKWQNCLRLWRVQDQHPAVLVRAVTVGTMTLTDLTINMIDSSYIGPVFANLAKNKEGDRFLILVRLGHVEADPDTTADYIVNSFFEKRPQFATFLTEMRNSRLESSSLRQVLLDWSAAFSGRVKSS